MADSSPNLLQRIGRRFLPLAVLGVLAAGGAAAQEATNLVTSNEQLAKQLANPIAGL